MGRRQDSVAHFEGAVGLLSDAQVMRYYDQANGFFLTDTVE